ncbi:MAG: hypothetical protein ACLRZ2_04035 [Veillonella sp.]
MDMDKVLQILLQVNGAKHEAVRSNWLDRTDIARCANWWYI